MAKLYNETGQVAVIVSYGYGAGWSSEARSSEDREELIFDPTLAQMVIDNATIEEMKYYAASRWPNQYLGGIRGLTVEWLDKGTLFIIDQYDGYESISYRDEIHWRTA